MGWDAFAETSRRAAFKAAAVRVRKQAGSVDGLLGEGGLDCSSCAYALEAATNASAWDEHGWNAEKVKQLAASATWPQEIDPEDKWAVLSAKAFLEVCAKLNCGISFSY